VKIRRSPTSPIMGRAFLDSLHIPGRSPSPGPPDEPGLLPDVECPIGLHRIPWDAIDLGQGLSERGQSRVLHGRARKSGNDPGRGMIPVPSEPVAELPIQGQGQSLKPEPVSEGSSGPEGAGVTPVGRAIGRLNPVFMEHRAQHLRAFENHLDDMLIRVEARAYPNVRIQNKDVHEIP